MNQTTFENSTTISYSSDVSDEDLLNVYIFYNTFRMIESILAIVGNSMTIAVVALTPTLHTASNVFLVSLAISDLTAGVVTPMSLAVSLIDQTPSWLTLCLIKDSFYIISVTGSALSVLAIAIDRSMAVFKPLKYETILDLRRAMIIALLIWALTLFISLSSLYIGQNLTYDKLCSFPIYLNMYLSQVLSTFYLTLMIVTALLYIRVTIVAWKHSRQINAVLAHVEQVDSENQVENLRKSQEQNQRRITKTMGLVLGIYFVLSMPVVLSAFIVRDRHLPLWAHYVYHIILILWWANCFVNPIIYVFRFKQFRLAYRKMLKLKFLPE